MARNNVIKKVKGKRYLYRQRSYREGGKVRTQSVYLGPVDESSSAQKGSVSSQSRPSQEDLKLHLPEPGTLDIPWDRKKADLTLQNNVTLTTDARAVMGLTFVSRVALHREYKRVEAQLQRFEVDTKDFGRIEINTAKTSTFKARRAGFSVSIPEIGQPRRRTLCKKNYRLALAHSFLDQIERQRPVFFDAVRTQLDRSYFATKWLVTRELLKSNEKHKVAWTLMFLWSGKMPQALEKDLKIKGSKKSVLHHDSWRTETAETIARIIQKGYKGTLKEKSAARSKAKTAAKRSLKAYEKIGKYAWLTKKGRKAWKRYKKHEARFLLASDAHRRVKVLGPLFTDFDKPTAK